ncbi:hypothetical protein GK047_24595 [Paenibacillus sp. SYP-B3998]|uniref:Uncharacterized protein n=1 Tax=Paenibacillus sp. SYP-B3998 TaxID=2678564 RepID=A0A6G4A4E4_9BACL|nr:hypothetical protein [Paenibacillus sp. SYP-B3998]NEW09158.1 hypothetical protein [Paenibacillus sp. SYP-B3998]
MDFFWFMALGTIETAAIYYLFFRMFNFGLYVTTIFFASVLATFISYTLRIEYGSASLDFIVQVVLMIAFCKQLFKIQVFYSIVMVSMGYVAYSAIQIIIYMGMNAWDGISDIPNPTSMETYILQFLSAGIAFGVGWLIKKTNRGFTFVPHTYQKNVFSSPNKNTIMLLIYSAAAIVPLALCVKFLFFQTKEWAVFIPITSIFILLSLLVWSSRINSDKD